MDTKQMLKDGFVKKQVVILVSKDCNGKEHFVVVDTLDHAKEYKTGESVRLSTMYVKEN